MPFRILNQLVLTVLYPIASLSKFLLAQPSSLTVYPLKVVTLVVPYLQISNVQLSRIMFYPSLLIKHAHLKSNAIGDGGFKIAY